MMRLIAIVSVVAGRATADTANFAVWGKLTDSGTYRIRTQSHDYATSYVDMAALTDVVGGHCNSDISESTLGAIESQVCVAWTRNGAFAAGGGLISRFHGDELNYVGNSSNAALGHVIGSHCGVEACVAWTDDGEFDAWGNPDVGGDASIAKPKLAGKKVVGASCGSSRCVAWTDDGDIASWGILPHHYNLIERTDVSGASCGVACVLWTNSGTFEVWAEAPGSPLAFVFADSAYTAQDAATILSNEFVIGAICGGNSCAAWSQSAFAVWGADDFDSSMTITGSVNVHCGSHACVAWGDGGNMYSWGDEQFGGDSSNVALTTGIVGAQCGANHCVAWTETGEAESWGAGPLIKVVPDSAGFTVGAHCGNNACVAWQRDGGLYTWGDPLSGWDSSPVVLSRPIAGAFCGYDICMAWAELPPTTSSTSSSTTTSCQNTDNGARNSIDQECTWYALFSSPSIVCGNFNDQDFDAYQMCCSCKGLVTKTTTTKTADLDAATTETLGFDATTAPPTSGTGSRPSEPTSAPSTSPTLSPTNQVDTMPMPTPQPTVARSEADHAAAVVGAVSAGGVLFGVVAAVAMRA